MKLRLRDNSLRLRLTQPEVLQLAHTGCVESQTHFPNHTLTYRLITSHRCTLHAQFLHDIITIEIPTDFAATWNDSPTIGLESLQPLPTGTPLRLLVEKDFECTDASPTEPQTGTYPNPNLTCK